MSFVSAENQFALWAIMLLLVALTLVLEKSKLGQKVSGPIIIIILTSTLSNLNIIPNAAPVYDTIWSYGVPIAVVLLLFNANIKKIFAESGPTLIAFSIGAFATVIGVSLGVYLLPLGENTPELAAVFSATYIGGSLNFAAVSEAIGFQESSLLSASLAVDNVVGTLFLALLIAMPSINFIAKIFDYKVEYEHDSSQGEVAAENTEENSDTLQSFSMPRMAFALGFGFLIISTSGYIADLMGYPSARLLVATILTVTISTIAHKRMARITEAFPIGMLIMYLFFGLIGAGVDIMEMLNSGMMIAAFATIILATHIIILLPICRLFRLSLPEVLVGSNACIIGPPTAAAMAAANGWNSLITPAILCGTFGYVIANFVGLTFFSQLN